MEDKKKDLIGDILEERRKLQEEVVELKGKLNMAAHRIVSAKQVINQQHELVMGMTGIALAMFRAVGQEFVVIPKILVEELRSKVSAATIRFDVKEEVDIQGLVFRIVEGPNQEALVSGQVSG